MQPYSEIYTGMKVYENGVVKYTFPNNGYYSRNTRYKIKYDETNSKISYMQNDIELYSTSLSTTSTFYFKFAHSRQSSKLDSSLVNRTFRCIFGINAS